MQLFIVESHDFLVDAGIMDPAIEMRQKNVDFLPFYFGSIITKQRFHIVADI